MKPDRIVFITESGPKFVDFLNLTDEIRKKYHYNPFDAGLALEARNVIGTVSKKQGFWLESLDEAQKKAIAEGKPLGFIMVWDGFFDKKASAFNPGSEAALLPFYNVFKDSVVIVIVSHERELGKVPDSVKKDSKDRMRAVSPRICARKQRSEGLYRWNPLWG